MDPSNKLRRGKFFISIYNTCVRFVSMDKLVENLVGFL